MTRPTLTIAQRIKFLDLIMEMAGNAKFERVLGLEPNDITYYKKLLDIETPDEARSLSRKLTKENHEHQEARIMEQTKRAREAEEVANQRLEQIEAERREEKPTKEYDVAAIKQEDADRQRRFESSQAVLPVPEKDWHLQLEGSQSQRLEKIEHFRRDIVNHGLSFCFKTYGATASQVKFEAERLGLKIRWDSVRR